MTTVMYGTKNCPDVRAALQHIAASELVVEFRNFDDSIANLKEFVRLRDSRAEFDEAKKNGSIGIPCFVTEEGKVCFDVKQIL
ncbi:MAG: glutaredoxin [Cloacibacillus sp.]